jgi:hypothetical protein
MGELRDMRRKNSPGCKCCGCVADALNVCICTCAIKVPRTLYLGDNNGTHALVWNNTSQRWESSLVQPGTDVYSKNPFTLACTNSTTNLNYGYALSFLCPPGTVGHPTGFWNLAISYNTVACPHGGTTIRYTNTINPFTFPVALFDIVDDFTCDVASGLAFNLPTVSPAGGLAVPGGGGSFLVLP